MYNKIKRRCFPIMKKSKIYIIACLIILSGIIIYFISYQSKTSDQECDTPIPSCYVLKHVI